MEIKDLQKYRDNPIVKFEFKNKTPIKKKDITEFDLNIQVEVDLIKDTVKYKRKENTITVLEYSAYTRGEDYEHFAGCINRLDSERCFDKPGKDNEVKLTYADKTTAKFVGNWETDYEMMAIDLARYALWSWKEIDENFGYRDSF